MWLSRVLCKYFSQRLMIDRGISCNQNHRRWTIGEVSNTIMYIFSPHFDYTCRYFFFRKTFVIDMNLSSEELKVTNEEMMLCRTSVPSGVSGAF